MEDHITEWVAAMGLPERREIEGLPETVTVHATDVVWVIERKADCAHPYTHTYATDTREVTIDRAVWRAVKACKSPVRLAIAHESGIWLHTSPDIRQLTPGQRKGGRRNRRGQLTPLTWFRFDQCQQVWPREPEPEPEDTGPDILEMFGGGNT